MTEKGFTPLEDAKRELLEETGHESSDWVEWFISDPLHFGRLEWNNYFFIARDCKKVKEQNLDAGEKIEVTFATFEEFLDFRNDPKARNKDLFPFLEKASENKEEKKKLQKLFGIKT
jgi:8-oxo-dGTP pyrophosphatase MutT (NUDIX family)